MVSIIDNEFAPGVIGFARTIQVVLDDARVTHTVVNAIANTLEGAGPSVAAVGMLRDNVAVIIGAMVIAPLLGPNVALAYNNHYPEAPCTSARQLDALGIDLAYYPVHGLRASVAALRQAFQGLAADPDLRGGGAPTLAASEVEGILGSEDYLARFG